MLWKMKVKMPSHGFTVISILMYSCGSKINQGKDFIRLITNSVNEPSFFSQITYIFAWQVKVPYVLKVNRLSWLVALFMLAYKIHIYARMAVFIVNVWQRKVENVFWCKLVSWASYKFWPFLRTPIIITAPLMDAVSYQKSIFCGADYHIKNA